MNTTNTTSTKQVERTEVKKVVVKGNKRQVDAPLPCLGRYY